MDLRSIRNSPFDPGVKENCFVLMWRLILVRSRRVMEGAVAQLPLWMT